MPYIKQTNRDHLDPIITRLVDALKELGRDQVNGNLNYTLTKLLLELYPVNKYHEISEAVGMLECCKLEWYRKRMALREDQAIYENGDVYPSPVEEPK